MAEEYPEKHGDYRYLWRKRYLDIEGRGDRGEAVFLMRNPATEEEEGKGKDRRHTTRSICESIARRLGYATFTEINLFALRAKDPTTLRQAYIAGRDIVGPENDGVICEVVSKADLLVVAWGSPGGSASTSFRSMYVRRAKDVRSLLEVRVQPIYCLKKTGVDTVNFPPQPIGSKEVCRISDLADWPPGH